MSDNATTFAAAHNSFGTSAHDTGLTSITLTGNPFTDLAALGMDLHGCTIRYLRSANANGHTVTGRFNISGREITAGACSYEGLIRFLAQVHEERRRYVAECRRRKRERNFASWLSRHPEFTFNHCNVTFR